MPPTHPANPAGLHTLTLTTTGPAATFDLGRSLGAAAAAGQVIALRGDLGAGKTTLTQGIAVGLGITTRVTSPTFTLVSEYEGSRRLRLIHIDIYRLGDTPATAGAEAQTFGLEEIFATAASPDGPIVGSVVVVEWAERVPPLLPDDRLAVEIETPAPDSAPDTRSFTLSAGGPRSAELLRQVRAQ